MKNEKTRLILLREDKSSLPKRGGNYVSDESIQLKQQEELKKELSRMHTSEAEIRADEREKWIIFSKKFLKMEKFCGKITLTLCVRTGVTQARI